MSRTESKTGNKVEANYLPWHTFTLIITSLSAYCLFLFTAPTSNPFPLGWMYSQLRSTVFPFWDIRLISDGMVYSMCVPPALKVTTGIAFCSSGCKSAGPHRAAVMDIQMSMIRDIMICRRLSPAVRRLIVFRCLMRSCSLRPPHRVTHSPAK